MACRCRPFTVKAGLNEHDDTIAPVIRRVRRRAVWLGISLFTAFLAAWVIGLFQATLEQIVALAVLMPIVASMGGVAVFSIPFLLKTMNTDPAHAGTVILTTVTDVVGFMVFLEPGTIFLG